MGRGYPIANGVLEAVPPPIRLDAVGAGVTGGSATASYTHNIKGGAILIGMSAYLSSSSSTPNFSCAVGGVNAPVLGYTSFWNDGGAPPAAYATVAVCGLIGPPQGNQTVVLNEPTSAALSGNSVSYFNLNRFVATVANLFAPSTTAVNPAAAGNPGELMFCCASNSYGSFNTTMTASPYPATQRVNMAFASGVDYAMVMADAILRGGATETFSTTIEAVSNWGAVIVRGSYR